MSAAACAEKIKIDSGRAIAGAEAFIRQAEELKTSAEKWFDRTLKAKGLDGTRPVEGELSTQQQKDLEALSQKLCEWGDRNFKWGDDIFKEMTRILVGSDAITYNDTAANP